MTLGSTNYIEEINRQLQQWKLCRGDEQKASTVDGDISVVYCVVEIDVVGGRRFPIQSSSVSD